MASIYDVGTLSSTNKYVGFKVGTSTNLQKFKPFGSTNAIPGCFYLTSDTHQLYVGNDNNTLSPVNQGIITVDSINDLPKNQSNQAAYTGHFYYCATPGVLAVYNGEQWVQVNPDTNYYETEEGFHTATDGDSGLISVSHTTKNNNDDSFTSSVNFAGTGGVQVSVSDGSPATMSNVTVTGGVQQNAPTVVIHATEYELKSGGTKQQNATSYDSVSIDYHEKDEATPLSSVVLEAGNNIILNKSADNSGTINISAHDTTVTSMTAQNAQTGTGFEFQITDSNNDKTPKVKIDPVIKYGTNTDATGDNRPTANFENGIASLDIYSKTEIENKLKDLNAMTYKGTIGSTNSTMGQGFNTTTKLPKNATSVEIGDVFLVDQTIEVSNSFNGQAIPKQSLIIARGTEDPTTGHITAATLTYDIVAPTADTDSHYYIQGSKIGAGTAQSPETGVKLTVKSDTGATNGFIQINEGSGIEVSSTSANNKAYTDADNYGDGAFTNSETTISIAHATYNTTAKTGTAVSQSPLDDSTHVATTTFPVVSGIKVTNGHITEYTTTNYTVRNTESYISSYASQASTDTITSGTKSVVGLKSQIKENFGDGTNIKTLNKTSVISSESLTLSKDSATVEGSTAFGVKVDLMWGSF